MSSSVHLEVASNQLRQDLSQIVDNFTLLDILSKEEQELVLETKIDSIKRKNQERMRRHQEIEADKREASREGSTSSPMSQTPPPPDQIATSPGQQSASPSLDSGHASPASSIERQREDSGGGGGGGDTKRPGGGKDAMDWDKRPGSGKTRQKQDFSPKDPSSMRTHLETIEIDLHTVGTGLGFGVMNFPGVGITVKTILPDGVAGKDGRLHSGDLLLQINDINVEKRSLNDVYDILKQCQGDVRLIVSREIVEVSRGPAAQRRDNQRRGHAKDASRATKKEDLTISIDVENDQGRPSGRGSGRGRGRTVRLSRDEVKKKEFEEKRKENLDRVDAEIAAMREALENQKAAGTDNPPPKSVYSFLDDPSRYGADPQAQRPPRGSRHDGGRRNQRSRGGRDGDSGIGSGRRKDQWGRGGSQQGKRTSNLEEKTTVMMTGKERQEYEEWKREREKIDQERIRRHQQAAAAAAAAQQETGWGMQAKQEKEDWDADLRTTQDQSSHGEMRIGHWDASNASTDGRGGRRTGGSHFEHDDRVSDPQPQHGNRIGSGRFAQDGHQRGRGGGRGFYRGGRGQDQGRRGRGLVEGGGADSGGRPGRRSTPSNRELSTMDVRTLPDYQDSNPRHMSEKTFQESPIGQWQPQMESDGDAGESPSPGQSEGSTSVREATIAAETLHIGPLPSPSAGSSCKSPLSPISPFTPTGHTFLADWAAETELRAEQEFSFEGDLVYNNSNTDQGS